MLATAVMGPRRSPIFKIIKIVIFLLMVAVIVCEAIIITHAGIGFGRSLKLLFVKDEICRKQ